MRVTVKAVLPWGHLWPSSGSSPEHPVSLHDPAIQLPGSLSEAVLQPEVVSDRNCGVYDSTTGTRQETITQLPSYVMRLTEIGKHHCFYLHCINCNYLPICEMWYFDSCLGLDWSQLSFEKLGLNVMSYNKIVCTRNNTWNYITLHCF